MHTPAVLSRTVAYSRLSRRWGAPRTLPGFYCQLKKDLLVQLLRIDANVAVVFYVGVRAWLENRGEIEKGSGIKRALLPHEQSRVSLWIQWRSSKQVAACDRLRVVG